MKNQIKYLLIMLISFSSLNTYFRLKEYRLINYNRVQEKKLIHNFFFHNSVYEKYSLQQFFSSSKTYRKLKYEMPTVALAKQLWTIKRD